MLIRLTCNNGDRLKRKSSESLLFKSQLSSALTTLIGCINSAFCIFASLGFSHLNGTDKICTCWIIMRNKWAVCVRCIARCLAHCTSHDIFYSMLLVEKLLSFLLITETSHVSVSWNSNSFSKVLFMHTTPISTLLFSSLILKSSS